jgi:monoamine oxidase
MKKEFDRREFIKQGVCALGSLSSYPLLGKAFSTGALQLKGAPKRVIIMGAGLAGLSAGYELSQLGHNVTVLEARPRAGGRVFTIREPFSDGLYAEAGAQFVPESHDLTMKYIKLFNVPLIQLEPSGQRSTYYIRGKRVLVNEDDEVNWPLALTAEEKKLGVNGLMKRYVDPVLKEMGDASLPDWPPERLRKYDQITMAEFLRMQGASAGAIELFRMGYLEINGDGIDNYSALSGLRDLVLGHAEKEYKIKGGSDLLPKAMAAQMTDKILYGSPVVRIEQSEKEVRVTFLQGGSHQMLRADHLICAIPFSTLKLIDVAPRFSPSKQKALERLLYTSVTRVYMQLRSKFWQAEGLSGEAYLDNPRMLLFPLDHSGSRDVYESFITGPQARHVMSLREGQRLTYVLEQAQKVMPAMRKNFEGGTSKSWDEDEWARGAWAWYKPGEMTSLLPHISRSEGRVHFAGEHTSAWPGWMQGAFVSGNRVAREVHEA